MRKIWLVMCLFIVVESVQAQKFITRTGKSSFFSSTKIEDIEAINNEGSCVLDPSNQQILFVIPIKSFRFDKALMQEHFNEQYMESDRFPKAQFKGALNGTSSIDFIKDGNYDVVAIGDLTIHGVTKNVSVPGKLTIKSGKVHLESTFKVKPADYQIKIPKIMSSKIAETVEVSIHFSLDKK